MSHDAIDPVCGMHVEEEKAAAKFQYKGRTYFFCSTGCREQFEKNPEKFLARLEEDKESHCR